MISNISMDHNRTEYSVRVSQVPHTGVNLFKSHVDSPVLCICLEPVLLMFGGKSTFIS